MARVPKSYPTEPGAQRCGDSYKGTIIVTGVIPGTDFGGHYTKSLTPVAFFPSTQNVPLFTSRDNLDEQLARPGGFEERLDAISSLFFLEDFQFSVEQRGAIQWLLDKTRNQIARAKGEADDIFTTALPGSDPLPDPEEHRKKTQTLIDDALKFLRCAEYWTHRVMLTRQAQAEYVAPLGFSPGPQLPVFPAPPESELPPVEPPDEEEEPPKSKKKKKKSRTGLIVFGIGLAVAGVVFLPKIFKKK